MLADRNKKAEKSFPYAKSYVGWLGEIGWVK
jgi:hypothetical protein